MLRSICKSICLSTTNKSLPNLTGVQGSVVLSVLILVVHPPPHLFFNEFVALNGFVLIVYIGPLRREAYNSSTGGGWFPAPSATTSSPTAADRSASSAHPTTPASTTVTSPARTISTFSLARFRPAVSPSLPSAASEHAAVASGCWAKRWKSTVGSTRHWAWGLQSVAPSATV